MSKIARLVIINCIHCTYMHRIWLLVVFSSTNMVSSMWKHHYFYTVFLKKPCFLSNAFPIFLYVFPAGNSPKISENSLRIPLNAGDLCDAGAMLVAIVLTAMAGPSQGLLQATPRLTIFDHFLNTY